MSPSNDAEVRAGAAELRRLLEVLPYGESPMQTYTPEGLDVWCVSVVRRVLEAAAAVNDEVRHPWR